MLPTGADGPVGPAIEVQAQCVLEMLEAILGAEKLGKERVVRCTAYLSGVEHWPAFNRVYAEFYG